MVSDTEVDKLTCCSKRGVQYWGSGLITSPTHFSVRHHPHPHYSAGAKSEFNSLKSILNKTLGFFRCGPDPRAPTTSDIGPLRPSPRAAQIHHMVGSMHTLCGPLCGTLSGVTQTQQVQPAKKPSIWPRSLRFPHGLWCAAIRGPNVCETSVHPVAPHAASAFFLCLWSLVGCVPIHQVYHLSLSEAPGPMNALEHPIPCHPKA